MTNPASQQPAPIPEDLILAHRWWVKDLDADKTYTVPTSAGVELIERIARLEAALRAVAATLYDPDSEIGQQVRAALSTPLGAPGREKEGS